MTIPPLNARLFFSVRTLINCAIIGAIFIPLTVLFHGVIGGWIATLLLIGALYFLFFNVLQKLPVTIDCPHCRENLVTNTPWVCGECGKTNRDVDAFPFVHRCSHCSAEPKAYRCHHCTELIFLGSDHRKQNFAYSLDNRPPDQTPPAEDDSVKQRKAREALIHEIKMAELAFQLEENKQRAEFGKKKTPVEEIEMSFSKFYARAMGSQEFAQRKRAEADETYKDQPDFRKRAHETIDNWLRERA
ncbi:MAG: hypothetical protein V4697_00805 [Patescibacteria group bacterium]